MLQTNDAEIRQAFHKKKLLRQHHNKNTLVIDELGLLHGSNRIDIAVVNGCIHGYEIKSSKDTLTRFQSQFEAYEMTLQKLTCVVAPNHLKKVIESTPIWVGIILAEKGAKGAIHFKTIRQAKKNPDVDPLKLAHLLWKNETVDLLKELGVSASQIKGNRLALYSTLVERVNLNELVSKIKATFEARINWRSGGQHA